MSEPILNVKDLRVHFDTYEGRQRVLDGVDLTIEEGETVALVGETGCGKSVTAKTIMGTLPQPPGEIMSGEIRFRGTDLLEDPEYHHRVRAEEMSMIFQDPMSHLSPVFTIGEMMTDVLKYGGRSEVSWRETLKDALGRGSKEKREERRERCVEMLRKLQIPDAEGVMDRYPVELSGGMRQRVLIAMALLNDPPFIIADEPTTALDVTVQEQIIDLLKERIEAQNLSVLYITHNLGVARELADRIYVMYGGIIAEYGETKPLFDDPLHPYTRGLVESIPKLTSFESKGIPGSIPDYGNPPTGCRFHPRCPAFMAGECDVQAPPLYEIGDERAVACYLYEEGMLPDQATEIAATEIDYRTSIRTDERSGDRRSVYGMDEEEEEVTAHEQ